MIVLPKLEDHIKAPWAEAKTDTEFSAILQETST